MTIKIDQEDIERYDIEIEENKIIINKPVYINIKNPVIKESDSTYRISTDNTTVTIWKEVENVHITIWG